MTELVAGSAAPAPAHGIAFGEAVRVWLRVAALSFGGPGDHLGHGALRGLGQLWVSSVASRHQR